MGNGNFKDACWSGILTPCGEGLQCNNFGCELSTVANNQPCPHINLVAENGGNWFQCEQQDSSAIRWNGPKTYENLLNSNCNSEWETYSGTRKQDKRVIRPNNDYAYLFCGESNSWTRISNIRHMDGEVCSEWNEGDQFGSPGYYTSCSSGKWTNHS